MNEPGRSMIPEFPLVPMREEYIPAVVDLLLAQEERHYARDPRLRMASSREEVTTRLTERLVAGDLALVALNQERRVRGYVSPGVWEIAETSLLRAFLPERSGVTRDLALADPQEGDASRTLAALLLALSSWWQEQGTTGELIRWPSADQWLVARLAVHGFQLDSVCALRGPHRSVHHDPPSGIVTRQATPADEEALVALFAEELEYHECWTPFVRCNPIVLAAFRRKLARLWSGASLEDGAPLALVAEREGEIVGMAETAFLDISSDDEPGFTPPGRYGCIDNVCVQELWRGQGIGKLLVQAVYEAFAALPLTLDGWLLWYNPDNQPASRFWAHRGFVPLWTTYQHLQPTTKDEAFS